MTFDVALQFSPAPGGRLRSSSPHSAEELYEAVAPLVEREPVVLDFSGAYGVCASFLDELAGRLVRRFGPSVRDRVSVRDSLPRTAENFGRSLEEALEEGGGHA